MSFDKSIRHAVYGELVHTETDAQGIEYQLYVTQDETPVKGNVLASGDDAKDRRAEDDVLARLDAGEVWAWASVTCRAVAHGSGKDCIYDGRDHLGGSSYKDLAEFIAPGGYWEDMKNTAKDELLRVLADAVETAERLGVTK